ncbi:protein kinase domain-containing protein [Micromonospora zamorensis]|uniref:serine/threonine-protein kinase n=1 Tax=Micromonospora zamorensis TaxID=709883 RepID=UPI003D8C74D9
MLIADRYRLLDLVGRGGMGRVWRARDEMLHREVAVKEIMPPSWLADRERDELRSRTLREARAAARLNHPAVVRLYDVIAVDGSPWIVMEYVPSRTLQDVVDADGPLEPAHAARIGLAVLDALHAAHTAGVLHRDIKPQNVLVAHDGRVMLTDFGLATFDGGDGAMTRPGMVLGSPQYVAPERAAEGVSTVAADLWSLGATLHAAVEGRSPYARSTAMATLSALAAGPPDPAPHAGQLAPVLAGLLRRDPRDRLDHDAAHRLLTAAATGRTEPTAEGSTGSGDRPEVQDPDDQDRTIPLPEPDPPGDRALNAPADTPPASTPPARRRTVRRAALIAVALVVAAAARGHRVGRHRRRAQGHCHPAHRTAVGRWWRPGRAGPRLRPRPPWPTAGRPGRPSATLPVCPSEGGRCAGGGRRPHRGRTVPPATRLGLARRHHRVPGCGAGDLVLRPRRHGGLLPGPHDRPGLQHRQRRRHRPAGPTPRGPRRGGPGRCPAGVRRDPAHRGRRWGGVGVPLAGPVRRMAARPAAGGRRGSVDAGLDHRRRGLDQGRRGLDDSAKQFPTTPLTCSV